MACLMPHKNDTIAWVETELNTSLILYLVLRQVSERVVICFIAACVMKASMSV